MNPSRRILAAALALAATLAAAPAHSGCPPGDPPKRTNACDTTSNTGSFVAVTEGAMGDDYVILPVPGASGESLDFALHYDSVRAFQEPYESANTCLGFGWTHSYNSFIYRYRGFVFCRDGSGRANKYTRIPFTSPVRYNPGPGYFESLIGDSDDTFSLVYPDGTIERFRSFAGCPYYLMSTLYQMTERIDRNGNTTTLEYDRSGRLAKIIDPRGRQIGFTYNAFDKIETITDPLGYVTRLDYTDLGCKLTRITDPVGRTVQYDYDTAYRVIRKVDKNGTASFYRFGQTTLDAEVLNPQGERVKLLSVNNPNGWALDPKALAEDVQRVFVPSTVTKIDARGNPWSYSYDGNGYPTEIKAPDSSTRRFAYDKTLLKRTEETDANGKTNRYELGVMGNTTGVIDPANNVTRYVYALAFNQVGGMTRRGGPPAFNQMISKTDPNGRTTTWQHDARGNLTNEIGPAPFLYTRSWTRDETGLATSETDQRSNTTYYAYDQYGNVAVTTNAIGEVTHTKSDPLGKLLWRVQPDGQLSAYGYDELGRRVAETNNLVVQVPWPPPAPDPPLLATETLAGGGILLLWQGQGWTLTRADNPLGPFLEVIAAGQPVSASPHSERGRPGNAAYFRLQFDPNPLAWPPREPEIPRLAVESLAGERILLAWEGTGWTLTRADDPEGPYVDMSVNGEPVTASPHVFRMGDRHGTGYLRLRRDTGLLTPGIADALADPDDPGGEIAWGSSGRSRVRLLSAAEPGDSSDGMTYGYDAVGNRTNATDCLGRVTTYQYDYRDRLVLATDALGYTIGYAYDDNNNRIAVTNQNGYVTRYEYDSRNRLTNTIDALGYRTSRTYDPVGNVLSETDANLHTTFHAYDELNRRIATTNAVGGVMRFEYAAPGAGPPCCSPTPGSSLVTKQIDANGKVAYYKYDALDRLTQVIRKQGDTNDVIDDDDAVTAYTYDANGNRLTVATRITATEYITNWFAYDAANRLVATANGAGDLTLQTYDVVGNVQTVTAPNANVTTNTYDARNRLIQVDDSIGRVASYTYDCVGNRLTVTDGNTKTVRHAYDALNRRVTITDAVGFSSTNYYDHAGNLVQVTDRMTNSTFYAFDPLNRRVAETNALGYATRYDYDGVGNLIRLTDANNHATEFQYDAGNRLARKIYPDDPVNNIAYNYDGVGNLVSRIDQKGQLTKYRYTDLNLLAQRDFPNDSDDFITYDVAGRMLTASKTNWLTGTNWQVNFAYDDANRHINTTQGGQILTYTYDTPGRTRGITYQSDSTFTITSDARGRMLTVSDNGSPPIVAYVYDSANRAVTCSYRNGVVAEYEYNPNNWITSLIHRNRTTGKLIGGFEYAYDSGGRKHYEHNLSNVQNSEAYQYDATHQIVDCRVGRLVGHSVPDPTMKSAWNLDPLGNWNAITTDGVLEGRTHNEGNTISSINSNSFYHDRNGNLTNDTFVAYAYDDDNRLVSARPIAPTEGSLRSDYAYDCLGRRIATWVYSWNNDHWLLVSDTGFCYDGWLLVNCNINERQHVTRTSYVWGMDLSGTQMDAGGIGGLVYAVASSQQYYYLYDARGNVRQIRDGADTAVAAYDYTPFGIERTHSGPYAEQNRFRFCTKYVDNETGFVYYGHRHYSPRLGRWLSRDPIGAIGSGSWMRRHQAIQRLGSEVPRRGAPRSLDASMTAWDERRTGNTYAFCLNNPINAYDVFGELSCIVKGWRIVALEARIASAESAIAFTTLGIAGAAADILAIELIKPIYEQPLLVAEQNLAMCLTLKELDDCKDCSYEQLLVDGLKGSVAELDRWIALYNEDLRTLYRTEALLWQQLGELSWQMNDLFNTPCTWP